ncbi:hypothetical protein [Nannocystis punicea]|uniref:Myxococcus cysteine-rich repeat-containing protein n=1 Tax=Nannocystis punicea TaxID=2995304 RepID=A0ABY7H2G1_9BACT|nr:hypothetical protein [Nannocystis poenicansa]WAS93449.1 hypothetical protein O0S08_45525 [Nannocystis poenicansa]
MRRCWLECAMTVMMASCGPTPGHDTDGGGSSSGSNTGASSGATSEDAPTSGGAPDLPPEGRCGDRVVDPGEACDEGLYGCNECTASCTVAKDPAIEWSVPLAPIVDVIDFDLTQQQRAWVLGWTLEDAPLLLRIEPDKTVATVDLGTLGFVQLFGFHVNGAAVDAVEVGVLGLSADDTWRLVRVGAEGVLGEPLTIPQVHVSSSMAVTSMGVTFARSEDASTLAWSGEVLATFADLRAGFIDAVGDRLVFGTAPVTLVDPDGGNRVETMCEGQSLSTSGKHVVFDATLPWFEEVRMTSCELETAAQVDAIVATGSAEPWVGPRADLVDAAPNGNPLGLWSVCEGTLLVDGCSIPRTVGLGGPGDPQAVEFDECDAPETARLGPDRGVYLIRRSRAGKAFSLVRRGTLPVAPPWG